jgi:phosphate-selective porin OprO/OprP
MSRISQRIDCLIRIGIPLFALCVLALPGHGDEPLTLQQLAAQVQQQQEQIRQLQEQPIAPAIRATDPGSTSFATQLDRELFRHRSSDGQDYRSRVNLIGRLHIDSEFAGQNQNSQELFGDLQNTVGFRRARLGAEGDIHRDVYWRSEFDFAGGSIAFRDVYLALRNIPIIQEIRLGHFREPFSLEGATSSNHQWFMERSIINQFDPGRNWGVGIFSYNQNETMTWALAAFRSGTERDGNTAGDTNDMAYDVRVTATPIYVNCETDYQVMHVGGAISYRVPPDNLVQFAPRRQLVVPDDSPASPITVRLEIPASHWELYNVQWAYVNGPWTLQSEWTGASINQLGGKPVFLHGCYAQASYFFTGERRKYDRKAGNFDEIHVQSPWNPPGGAETGWGAWEGALRFDFFDTSDPAIPEQPQSSARVQDLYSATAGLNWYLNNYTRFMTNYTVGIPKGFDADGAIVHMFGLRFAIHW